MGEEGDSFHKDLLLTERESAPTMTPSLYLAATMVVPVDTPPWSCLVPAAGGSSSIRPRLEPAEEKYSCPGKEMATANGG